MPSLRTTFAALTQLGLKPVLLNALYRQGLHTGRWRKSPRAYKLSEAQVTHALRSLQTLIPVPERQSLLDALGAKGWQNLHKEASEIIAGNVRLFGAEPVPLKLTVQGALTHWSEYELGRARYPDEDPKLTWEPARFAWAFTLGRDYLATGDEACAQAFWNYLEQFIHANPAYQGPHWVSAQEVSLRLIAFAWGLRVFSYSPHSTPPRQATLLHSIVEHAVRIPPTLIYARSQNNNHLLTEAAGLFTAGLLLTEAHPQAKHWQVLGWRWFQYGIREQIAIDGSYIQHSNNYHRLMLQTAAWMYTLSARQGIAFPAISQERLASATRWLLELLDSESGCLPNLGSNDGAYIFPLTTHSFPDYRPILEAASRAFLHKTPSKLISGDELSLWFGLEGAQITAESQHSSPSTAQLSDVSTPAASPNHRLSSQTSWAVLRAAHFTSRPGHADQLHLDLWWRGLNIAQDPGTYRYTAPAPWDNALTHAVVHNTVTVNGLDQMTRRGRFLYLDWAQAKVISREQSPDDSWTRITACHNGYRQLGILHQRSVTAYSDDRWLVEDRMIPSVIARSRRSSGDSQPGARNDNSEHTFRLHWLLPDWQWQIEGNVLRLESPYGRIQLTIATLIDRQPSEVQLSLVRGGERLLGNADLPHQPILGWVSPTYTVKVPALSLVVEVHGWLPVQFSSEWQLLP
jgi:hypothetical protein